MLGGVVLVALAALCAGAAVEGKLTFQVEPRSSECFYSPVAMPGHSVHLKFWVLRGGLLDIDLRIKAPSGAMVFSGLQFESNERTFFAGESGDYEICWNNEMSRWTAKVVQFEATVQDAAGVRQEGALAKAEPAKASNTQALTPMQESIRKLSESLDNIQNDQKYLSVREQRHRDTAEDTNGRVAWYSLFESAVLLSISFGQVYYLRRFFDGGGRR